MPQPARSRRSSAMSPDDKSQNASECLPYREEELKMTYRLPRRGAEARQLRDWFARVALQQLQGVAAETQIRRRVDAVRKITSDRTHRSAIPDSETDSVCHVVEVVQISLTDSKGDIADRAVHVAHVMKQDALDVRPKKRESQFRVVEEQGVASQRESGRLRARAAGHQWRSCIARSGLVEWESPERIRTTAEKTLGQRDCLRIGQTDGS